jgi:hypothetical protein
MTAIKPEAIEISTLNKADSSTKIVGLIAPPGDPIADPLYYNYHELSALALGRGFDPSNVIDFKKACIEFEPERLNQGAVAITATTVYVTSTAQLNETVGLDIKAEASYLVFKGDLHLHFDYTSMFRTNTVSVVFLASTQFGRWGLKAGAKLTQEAADLCKANPVEFSKIYGTRYVDVEHRGASVSAVVTILSVSTEFKAAFDADMSASGGWGPVSGSASNKLNSELKNAAKQQRVTVEVSATGGAGFAGLSGVVLNGLSDQPLEATLNALSNFIAHFTEANAASTKYHVRSMFDFGWDDSKVPPWTTSGERALQKMAAGYKLVNTYRDISKAISNGSHPLASVLSKTALGWIAADIPLAETYLDEVAVQHNLCKQQSDYRIPSQPDMSVRQYLSILDPPRIAIRVNALTAAQKIITLTLEQGRLVLNALPEQRLLIAKTIDSSIVALSAMFQTEGSPYGLSLTGVFVKSTSEEYRFLNQGAWDDGHGFVWYATDKSGFEGSINEWMISAQGAWNGVFYFIIKDKLGRTFRIAFMEAEWVSDLKTLSGYQFNLVY